MTKQSLKDNVTSNDILSKKFWILTKPKMSFYWCLLKKKFEKIEGDLLAHVRQIQNTFLQPCRCQMSQHWSNDRGKFYFDTDTDVCGRGPGYKLAGGAISGLRGSDITSDMFAAPLVLGKMCHGTSWCKLFVAIQDSIKGFHRVWICIAERDRELNIEA